MNVHFMKRNDTAPAIGATLSRRDAAGKRVPIDLTDCEVNLVVRKFGAKDVLFKRPCVLVDKLTGKVRYDWVSGDTATAGTYRGEFEVTFSTSGTIQTHANTAEFRLKIREDLG